MRVDKMAFEVEVVMNIGVNRGELLQRLHLAEAQHGSLSSSERQVTVLDPIVGVSTDLLPVGVIEASATL